MEFKIDDTFLARWLNGELSEEELEAFKSSPEYPKYQKIVHGMDQFVAADFDQEAMLERIKSSKQETKTVKVRPMWTYYGVAAAIVLIISFFFIFDQEVTVDTGFGEQLSFTLPDQSEVILNANSSVTYPEKGWESSRQLVLQGEAFFNVSKGNTFTVNTAIGKVTVLGTQFNVQVHSDWLEVTCYEGKVEVRDGRESTVLIPGRVYRKNNRRVQKLNFAGSEGPSWTKGESTFRSTPASIVLTALENQFGITFEGKDRVSSDLFFSGSFPHDDAELALKIVLRSMQINYTRKGETVFLENR